MLKVRSPPTDRTQGWARKRSFSSPAQRGRRGRSRRRGRRRRYRLTNKAIRHVVRVGQHVRCRNPLNHDPSRCEPRIARLVPLRLIPHVVAPPIHLHRQPRRRAVEVEHVRPKRMLPPKPRQSVTHTPEPQPQLHFRRRHLAPEPFRSRLAPFSGPHPESVTRRRPLRHGAYPHRATSPAAQGRRRRDCASPHFSSPAKRGRWRRSRRRGRPRDHGLPTSPSSNAIGQSPARDAPSVTARIRAAPPPPLRREEKSQVPAPCSTQPQAKSNLQRDAPRPDAHPSAAARRAGQGRAAGSPAARGSP